MTKQSVGTKEQKYYNYFQFLQFTVKAFDFVSLFTESLPHMVEINN